MGTRPIPQPITKQDEIVVLLIEEVREMNGKLDLLVAAMTALPAAPTPTRQKPGITPEEKDKAVHKSGKRTKAAAVKSP